MRDKTKDKQKGETQGRGRREKLEKYVAELMFGILNLMGKGKDLPKNG